jgi:hypothetical protein
MQSLKEIWTRLTQHFVQSTPSVCSSDFGIFWVPYPFGSRHRIDPELMATSAAAAALLLSPRANSHHG